MHSHSLRRFIVRMIAVNLLYFGSIISMTKLGLELDFNNYIPFIPFNFFFAMFVSADIMDENDWSGYWEHRRK